MRRWLRRIAAPAPPPCPRRPLCPRPPAPVASLCPPLHPARSPHLLPPLLSEAQFKRGLRVAAAVRQGDLGYNERHAYFVR